MTAGQVYRQALSEHLGHEMFVDADGETGEPFLVCVDDDCESRGSIETLDRALDRLQEATK